MGAKWWTITEIESLKTQLQQGIAIDNVKIPGRKTEYIKRKARIKVIVEKQRFISPTEEQKAKLRELKQQGLSARKISELNLPELPRLTANAIQKIFGRLGLVDEKKSRAAKNKKRWLNGEKQVFDDFLLQNSKMLAPQEIAEIFGVDKATVINRQKAIGVKTSLAETLAIPYVKKEIEKAVWKHSQKMLLCFEKHIAEREKQLEALAQKLREKKQMAPAEERHCKKCGRIWLRHRKFFYHATYKTKRGTSWHFSRVCVICMAKKHHQKNVARYEKKYSQRLE